MLTWSVMVLFQMILVLVHTFSFSEVPAYALHDNWSQISNSYYMEVKIKSAKFIHIFNWVLSIHAKKYPSWSASLYWSYCLVMVGIVVKL